MTTVLSVAQYNYIKGGSDTYRFGLDRLLLKNGYKVVPFTSRHPDNEQSIWNDYFPNPVDFENPGLSDIFHYIYSRPAAKALRTLLEAKSIDLAHLHIYYGQLTASILNVLKERDIPIVQTLHEYKIVCPTYALLAGDNICTKCNGKHYWRAIQQRCNRGKVSRSILSAAESYVSKIFGAIDKVDHFISVSNFQRELLIKLGISADKITTVHNFIDAKGTNPSFEAGRYFLYFGRLERSKGLWTLLKAVKRCPECRLLIVGDGTQKTALEDYLARFDIANVQYLGFKRGKELGDLIRNSICTITPSEWYETFGLTILESFAHGRPVIASRIGGMQETVAEGLDGLFIEPGDYRGLAEHMKWMASHQSEAIDMGRKGREKVLVQFTPEEHYSAVSEIYKNIM